ncbi:MULTISPECIES: hypothetical protein [Bacillaceae]|jgi:hypothetical protein|uniref:hypothetical protein n=1 Tax=Bacillaceae TaxID=186817 RepID=UPI001653524D|nr:MULTISPECIES: hypothetical protein [Bacillaceae]MDT9025897.1 hypothetical protein [Rossellomorea sp. YC4-1]WRP07163.1 hypothetical protein U9J35_03065 [Rossellomorea aquimaris]
MEFELILVLFMAVVVISLWVVHSKLNRITEHVQQLDEEYLSDEQIEKELEEEWYKDK